MMAVIYKARCSECDSELDIGEFRLDSDDDLCVKIVPCPDCMNAARDEGHAEAERNA